MFNTFWGEFAHTGSPSEDLSVWPYYTEKKLVSNRYITMVTNLNTYSHR